MQRIIKKLQSTKFKVGDYPGEPTGEIVDYELEVYNEGGELLLGYYKAPLEIYKLAKEICKGTKPTKSTRTRHGVPQLSTVYGPLPRIPIREDYCRFSNKSKEEKLNYSKAIKLNELIASFYKQKHPKLYETALTKVKEEINKDYFTTDTPWTNINVNLNQVIKYHCDKGNNTEDLSNVLVIKENVSGGYLDCPQLGLTLHQGDGWLCFFKGQEIIHGVTPCLFKNKTSFRCSIVNYTLKNLKHCYPYEQELKRLKQVKSNQAINKKQNLLKLREYFNKAKGKNG
jgi:hypothetical protein